MDFRVEDCAALTSAHVSSYPTRIPASTGKKLAVFAAVKVLTFMGVHNAFFIAGTVLADI